MLTVASSSSEEEEDEEEEGLFKVERIVDHR
jgi:hypothetical protein